MIQLVSHSGIEKYSYLACHRNFNSISMTSMNTLRHKELTVHRIMSQYLDMRLEAPVTCDQSCNAQV